VNLQLKRVSKWLAVEDCLRVFAAAVDWEVFDLDPASLLNC